MYSVVFFHVLVYVYKGLIAFGTRSPYFFRLAALRPELAAKGKRNLELGQALRPDPLGLRSLVTQASSTVPRSHGERQLDRFAPRFHRPRFREEWSLQHYH